MIDIILCGLFIGLAASALYCLATGVRSEDCPWQPLLLLTPAGILAAYFLPRHLVEPVTNLAMAIVVVYSGYGILSHQPKDEHEKNNRWLGWMLIVIAVLIGLSGLCDVFC